jgi:hypothetical protein
MDFISILNKMPKDELVKLARKHNTINKIPNIHKLKKHDLIVELLMFQDEIKKIYYGDDNDKSLNDIKTAKGQKIRAPPKKDQTKLNEDINVLLKEQIKKQKEILDTENISEADKLTKMKQIKEISKQIEKLTKHLSP